MLRKIGFILLAVGIVTLVAAIALAFAVGGNAVPILTAASILINSAAIMMIRGKF